jgi:hypothetical protein
MQIHIQIDHFFICAHINLSTAQIELCLDAKHWDLNVWTFARCIAFICAKMVPICICGTLTPKRLVHIFAFNSERIYINLASTAAAAAPAAAATASIFQINKGTLKSTCLVTSSNRVTKIPTTTHLIFLWVSRRCGI